MRTIPLTKDRVAIVDDEDFEEISKHNWQYHAGYAARTFTPSGGRKTIIWMHREINGTPTGMHTDHIDLDRLNNRRGNLRTCTARQNFANAARSKANTTGSKGVTRRECGFFRARIMVGRKSHSLGNFSTLEAAAAAYERAARRIHGEFARTA